MTLLKPVLKSDWDGGSRRTQQRREDGGQIEASLTYGANDAGEHLLRIRSPPRAIASTDFPSHDRGPNRLLGAPVRCVDPRRPQKGEDGRELGGEMCGEAQARQETAARDGEALIRDGLRVSPVTEGQAVEEHLVHGRGPGALRMIQAQRARIGAASV